MKTMALIQRTAGFDIDEDAFKGAINADDSKAALIELIVRHQVLTSKNVALTTPCSVQGYCSAGNDLNSKGAPVGPYTEGGWVTTATCIDTLHAPAGCHYEVSTSLDGKGTKYTYTESAAMGANGGPGWDKVRSIRVFKAGQGESSAGGGEPCEQLRATYGIIPGQTWGTAPPDAQHKWTANSCDSVVARAASGGGGGCGCCQEMCYVWGDPHIIQFDGQRQDFYKKSYKHYWLLKSANVHVQGFVMGAKSWTKGVAVGGPFLDGHSLVAAGEEKTGANTNGFKVYWDGKEILNQDGVLHPAPGVELHREKGTQQMPTTEEFKDAVDRKDKYWKDQLAKVINYWKGRTVYTFRLPQKVEVFVTLRDAVEILIKAPKQGTQGGWCGNANGDDLDDRFDKLDKSSWEERGLNVVKSSENLFTLSGVHSFVQKTATGTTGTEQDDEEIAEYVGTSEEDGVEPTCPPVLHAKAEKACAHIPEELIRGGCIIDICLTDDVSAAIHAADGVEVMEILEGQGIPEFVGHGKCLSDRGDTYSTIAAKSYGNKKDCARLLQEVGSIAGVRGAQYTDGGSCKILIEGVKLRNHQIAGGWGHVSEGLGTGVVDSSSTGDGEYCWRVH